MELRIEGDRRAVEVKCAPKEWPLFSAPGLSSMRVVGHKEKGGILFFSVMAILEGFKWKVDRTYEEFCDLQRILTKLYGMDHPPLPGFKRLFGFGLFGSTKPSQIEEMRKNLEGFIMGAVTSWTVPPTELLKFVEYPFTDVLSVTQALAKFFYTEGEVVLSNNKAVQMSPLQIHCINKRMTLPLASSESGKMKDDFGHLLDFLQNLKKLKITPPTEEHAIANSDNMTFDLAMMKSLEVLLAESVNLSRLEARYVLPKQLVKLEVRRSIKNLQEILLVYPSTDVDHSPSLPATMPLVFTSTHALDLSQAMPWEKLQQANFKLNGIKKIDESVKLLLALERLDLSFNYIEEIEHLVELPHLRVLDLSHNKITCLQDLHTRLGNITKLSLASNNIVRLNGFQKVFSIQYLDLSNNQISDASEVHHLDPLPCLEKLFLKGNPLCSSLSYRSQIFSNLPHCAEQVALDGKQPTKDELVVSISTPTTSHRKVLRTPNIQQDAEVVANPEELEDMEVGMTSKTSHLEDLRKKGGDEWLTILNADKAKDDSDLVAPKSPSSKSSKKKKTRHTHSHTHSHKTKAKKGAPEIPHPLEVSEGSISFQLDDLLKASREETQPNTISFSVTVLEYRNSSFLSLSPGDLDQLLQNTAMEECTFSIDTTIGKALEIDLATKSTRVKRDLRLIYHIKIHEGKRLAVCLQLPSSRSSSLGGSKWLLYCVQSLGDLAKLYSALKAAMARRRSNTPDHLNDLLSSIKSDTSGSITSFGTPPTSLRAPPNGDHSHLEEAPASSASAPAHDDEEDVSRHMDSIGSPGSEHMSSLSKADLATLGDFGGDMSHGSDPHSPPGESGGAMGEVGSPQKISEHSQVPSVVVLEDPEIASSSTGSLLKSCSPTSSSPLDSFSSAGVMSPAGVTSPLTRSLQQQEQGGDTEQQGGTEQADSPSVHYTHLHGEDTPDQSDANQLRSHSRERSQDRLPSKVSSTSSSRVGSGANTPRTQLGASPARQGIDSPLIKSKESTHSPTLRGTPPVTGKAKMPPQNLPAAVKDKLESIMSPDVSLPSPLYCQPEITTKSGDDGDDCGDEDDTGGSASIYDPPPVVPPEPMVDTTDIIKAAVDLSRPDSSESRMGRRRERKVQSAPRSIMVKPGLDDNNLRLFFKKSIADETSEILMNITWGVSNLPSAPSCEVETGTIISDRGIYLLEVLDPEKHELRPLSWTSESFPLAKIACCYHQTLRKVSIGIFDQSVTVEAFEKGLVKRFVFFPHTYDKLNLFVENLKAAFDASNMPYSVASPDMSFVVSVGNELLIQNPNTEDMVKLKEDLIWSQSLAQVGNSMALSAKSDAADITTTTSFDVEVMKASSKAAGKFDIVQYVIVGELSADTLPISHGGLHVQSRALILTNDCVYLCKEELGSWRYSSSPIRTPPFPRCMVLDAHPMARISAVKVCDKSHPIVSYTDPLYEFSISFEELDDIQLSPTLSAEWVLCVHDRQYLDQLLNCLVHLSNEHQKENQKLITTKHTSTLLSHLPSPKPPRDIQSDTRKEAGSSKKAPVIVSSRGVSPSFFSSRILYEFSVSTNSQRLEFFKKHVAQAEFMKADEVPLSVFLAHCSSSLSEYVEVEACVIVSNYALYLLSDVDSIQQWVETGGVSSFQRRNLLDRKNSCVIRSFYRLWLTEMKQVDVGVFYDAVAITDIKEPGCVKFTIHTENPSATLSFLSALSCVIDLHDSAEEQEMDDLLSSYDMMPDTVQTAPKKSAADKQHKVECVYHSDDHISRLKRAMVAISPVVAKGVPRDQSAPTLTILYQQVVLLVEEFRIRDLLTSKFYPHVVFLTNYGLFVCLNETSDKCSPSVLDPNSLRVKKWCHVDLLERLHVTSPATSQYSCYNVIIYLRNSSRASLSSDDATSSLSILVQNSELLGCLLYHFSLMCSEKSGKKITITRD